MNLVKDFLEKPLNNSEVVSLPPYADLIEKFFNTAILRVRVLRVFFR